MSSVVVDALLILEWLVARRAAGAAHEHSVVAADLGRLLSRGAERRAIGRAIEHERAMARLRRVIERSLVPHERVHHGERACRRILNDCARALLFGGRDLAAS